ncbi:class I SAM-dependent RNA methyltransferase [Microbacterium sp. ZW T5_56]|uniref:class I SAM-dependent RNA methyltransferase n=1 Tax=Microbacterium sp. ZW T5_56 TaxID=3378081 RepID=UPI0038550F70
MPTPDEDTLDLTITGVAHGGVFVARHEGRVVFVSDAIPGETVRARLTDTNKKSFWRAETVEVLEASAHRRPHVWAPADVANAPEDRPGGADFGHIDLAHQRTLKSDVLTDALRRFGGIERAVDVAPVDGETDGLRWRTRVSLHVDDAGNVGPYAARSHRVIPVEQLPLATLPIERAADKLFAGRGDRIDLVQPADGRVRVVNRRAEQDPREQHDVIIETVGDRGFQVDADGFWQVHRGAAATLDAAIRRLLAGDQIDPDAWHLDLYGGVGLFGATVAGLGGTRVTSVESDARATEHAGENLAEWVGARAETARVDRYLRSLVQGASTREKERLSQGVVVLDPPRTGAGRGVVTDLAALSPRTIVYVACDPVALARDLGTFGELGYAAEEIEAFDLFPHSHHLETVALLRRAG